MLRNLSVSEGLLAARAQQLGCAVVALATEDHLAFSALSLPPADTCIERDLLCERAIVRGDDDTGVRISGPAAFSFIFARDIRHIGDEAL